MIHEYKSLTIGPSYFPIELAQTRDNTRATGGEREMPEGGPGTYPIE